MGKSKGASQERRLRESGKRGAAAMHAAYTPGPKVDSYERARDIRAEVAREDAERRGKRCKW